MGILGLGVDTVVTAGLQSGQTRLVPRGGASRGGGRSSKRREVEGKRLPLCLRPLEALTSGAKGQSVEGSQFPLPGLPEEATTLEDSNPTDPGAPAPPRGPKEQSQGSLQGLQLP